MLLHELAKVERPVNLCTRWHLRPTLTRCRGECLCPQCSPHPSVACQIGHRFTAPCEVRLSSIIFSPVGRFLVFLHDFTSMGSVSVCQLVASPRVCLDGVRSLFIDFFSFAVLSVRCCYPPPSPRAVETLIKAKGVDAFDRHETVRTFFPPPPPPLLFSWRFSVDFSLMKVEPAASLPKSHLRSHVFRRKRFIPGLGPLRSLPAFLCLLFFPPQRWCLRPPF